MSEEQFRKLPTTTNAVESHNRLSKTEYPEILRAAMLSTYKINMSVALEPLKEWQQVMRTQTQKQRRERSNQMKMLMMKDHQTKRNILNQVGISISGVLNNSISL